jgi:uncharacterized protein
MHQQYLAELQAFANQLSSKIPELQFLVLFGSRARGEETEQSDWDFAMLTDESEATSHASNSLSAYLSRLSLLQETFQIAENQLDLIDLHTCSDLTAHFISRDGKLLYEKNPGEFEHFRKQHLKNRQELKAYRNKQRAYVSEFLEGLGA